MLAARDGRRGEWELLSREYRISVVEDGNVLEMNSDCCTTV